MIISSFPFQAFDWANVVKEVRNGETGFACWQTKWLNDIRIRLVEYSADYKADHWCSKGHVLYCQEGEMETELADGRTITLKKGMCYLVGDHNEPHRTSTTSGCKLFIVD